MSIRWNCVLFSGICGALVFVLGCSLDSSSDISDNVDTVLGQESGAIQQALAEPAPQQTSSSSSPSRSSTPRASTSSSSGGGGGGFVWKPISDGDGNLVVLLPPSLTGSVAGVRIVKGGSGIEQGRPTGPTNGNRETFRFSAPGAAYGSGLTLVATLKNGTSRSWSIGNGGQRVG